MENLHLFKECFKNISIKELNLRISNFRKYLQIRSISEENLRMELRKVFLSKIGDEQLWFFLNNNTLSQKNHQFYFYRVRKFENRDIAALKTRDFPSMQSEQNAWWKPKEFVDSYGRLHRPKQSMLYVSKEVSNSLYETGCREGDYFFLIIYETKKRMLISQIHNISYIDELAEVDNGKRIIMHQFLYSEFSKLVPKGKEYLYKSSLLIYEEFFKDEQIDSFGYPSIASTNNNGFNMAFTEKRAKENLDLVGVMACRIGPFQPHSEFMVQPLYDGFLHENKFLFYPFNSPEARQKFGRFNLIRDHGLL